MSTELGDTANADPWEPIPHVSSSTATAVQSSGAFTGAYDPWGNPVSVGKPDRAVSPLSIADNDWTASFPAVNTFSGNAFTNDPFLSSGKCSQVELHESPVEARRLSNPFAPNTDHELDSCSSHNTTPTTVCSSSSQQFPSTTSPASSFTETASSKATSDSCSLAFASSGSSTSAVFLSGASDNVQLLGAQNRFDVDGTLESDSGHSTEVAPANSTQTPPNIPNSAYRELIDESEQEQSVEAITAHSDQQEKLPGHGNSAGGLQVPKILFTEATLSSSALSLETVSSSEPTEGRTHLLESSAAEDANTSTKEDGDRPHIGYIFKSADSDEDERDQLKGEPIVNTCDNSDVSREQGMPYADPNVSQSDQNMAMNISAIEPTGDREAGDVDSTIFMRTPPADGRRRSAPSDLHRDGESELTDFVNLTKTYSVDTLHKGLECLNVSQQPSRVFTSSPIAPRSKASDPFEHSEPLRRWREQFHQRIALQNAGETKAIEELRMEAKRDIEIWYADRQENISSQHSVHLENETGLRSRRNDLPKDAKSAWNRMVALAFDLQRTHKADEVNKDVSRMKELLQLLRSRPPFRRLGFACIDPSGP